MRHAMAVIADLRQQVSGLQRSMDQLKAKRPRGDNNGGNQRNGRNGNNGNAGGNE